MTIFLNAVFIFILAYLVPVIVLKGFYKEPIKAPVFFWFALALTGLIINNNWI